MNPQVLGACQQIAAGVMANVTADQLEAQTPCSDWNVGQLIDHMVGAQHWGRSAMEGVAPEQNGEGSSQGDFNAVFAEASQACLDSFCAEGAMEKTVNPGFGDMPAAGMLGLMMNDTFQHAWDLAKATGQDTDLAPEMAQQILAASQQMIQPGFRSEEGTIFGLEKQAPEGASAADQLAAFLGRDV